MAASDAAICNLALTAIGHTKYIASISEDSEEADVCNTHYAQCRDEVLEEFDWPFATGRVFPTEYTGNAWSAATTNALNDLVTYSSDVYLSLQASNTNHQPDTSPTWWAKLTRTGWSRVFAWPTDPVLKLRYIDPGTRTPQNDAKIRYAVEYDPNLQARVIVTDEEDPELVYTRQITDTLLFSPAFTNALRWRLAMELVLGLRKDPKMGNAMESAYRRAIATATAAAKQGVQPDPEPDAFFIAAR